MSDIFYNYIRKKIKITDEEYEILQSVFVPKKLKRKQYLLQEGDIAKTIAFVTKGILRLYKIDNKGHENVLQFAPEEWWISDRESLLTGKASGYYIDALENSEVLLVTWSDFKFAEEKVPPFRDMHERLHQNYIIAQQKRIHAAISYTAEEKYNEFINIYPQIHSRVPLHMIASYLGISPETLSRIRSKN